MSAKTGSLCGSRRKIASTVRCLVGVSITVACLLVHADEWTPIPREESQLIFTMGTLEWVRKATLPGAICEASLYESEQGGVAQLTYCDAAGARAVFVREKDGRRKWLPDDLKNAQLSELRRGKNELGPLDYQTFTHSGLGCVVAQQFRGRDFDRVIGSNEDVFGTTMISWWYCEPCADRLTDQQLETIFRAVQRRKVAPEPIDKSKDKG